MGIYPSNAAAGPRIALSLSKGLNQASETQPEIRTISRCRDWGFGLCKLSLLELGLNCRVQMGC